MSRFEEVLLFSDSQYVTDNFVKAMNVWPQPGWRGANGTPVKMCSLRVEVRWVQAGSLHFVAPFFEALQGVQPAGRCRT